MKTYKHETLQKISWVKSDKRLESAHNIENLYYPESRAELISLLQRLISEQSDFLVIGHSSNTLFLPSFHCKNVVCTKFVNYWNESDTYIDCDCGVSIGLLSKKMVNKGFIGFEGLTDLPGTLAGGIYGNSGCRGCSVNELLISLDVVLENGEMVVLSPEKLNLKFRSSIFKRRELKGTIISAKLKRIQGNAAKLKEIAEKNHRIRKENQPSGANNLGSTFDGGHELTHIGRFFHIIERIYARLFNFGNSFQTFPFILKMVGKSKFIQYTHGWNRYLFNDAKSHDLFPKYITFIQSIYKDAVLEIEIRK